VPYPAGGCSHSHQYWFLIFLRLFVGDLGARIRETQTERETDGHDSYNLIAAIESMTA